MEVKTTIHKNVEYKILTEQPLSDTMGRMSNCQNPFVLIANERDSTYSVIPTNDESCPFQINQENQPQASSSHSGVFCGVATAFMVATLFAGCNNETNPTAIPKTPTVAATPTRTPFPVITNTPYATSTPTPPTFTLPSGEMASFMPTTVPPAKVSTPDLSFGVPRRYDPPYPPTPKATPNPLQVPIKAESFQSLTTTTYADFLTNFARIQLDNPLVPLFLKDNNLRPRNAHDDAVVITYQGVPLDILYNTDPAWAELGNIEPDIAAIMAYLGLSSDMDADAIGFVPLVTQNISGSLHFQYLQLPYRLTTIKYSNVPDTTNVLGTAIVARFSNGVISTYSPTNDIFSFPIPNGPLAAFAFDDIVDGIDYSEQVQEVIFAPIFKR